MNGMIQHAQVAPSATSQSRRRGNAPIVRGPSKADQVYHALKEAILTGELSPGSPIDKIAVGERLGISRFPIGAAIDRLAFEKLVVVEPQHGSFVTRISPRDVREFMLIRRAVESDLAAEAARRATPALDADLQRSLHDQAIAVEAADQPGFFRLDVEFHQIIIQALDLPNAADVIARTLSHLERARQLLNTPSARAAMTLREHTAIAEAIMARDPCAAAHAARAHLDRTTATFDAFVHENPTLFAEPDDA